MKKKNWGSWLQKLLMKMFPQIQQTIAKVNSLVKAIRTNLKNGDVDKAMAKIDELLDLIGDIINPNK